VAATGIVAGVGQQRGVTRTWDAAFREANGAHAALFLTVNAPVDKLLRDLAVVDHSGPFRRSNDTQLVQGETRTRLPLRASPPELPRVERPLLRSGRWLSGADDEIVIERSFAMDRRVRVGDRVHVTGRGTKSTLRVVGTALVTLDCPYPQCSSQTGWVTPPALARLAPTDEGVDSILFLRLRDPQAIDSYTAKLFDTYGDALYGVNDWKDTRADVLVVNRFFGAFLAAFGVFLLIAAGLVIAATVMSRVLMQYREIGVMKAVGFTPRQITALLLLEHTGLAAIGAVLGYLAGALLAPRMELRLAQVLGRGGISFPLDSLLATLIVVELIVIVGTFLPAWRAGRVPASRAVTHGAEPPTPRRSLAAAMATRVRLGVSTAVGLKDVGARRLRATLSIATLAITIVSIMATLGFQRTVSTISRDPAIAGNPFDLVIAPLDTHRVADIESALGRDDGVTSWFTSTSRRATTGVGTFQVRALGGNLATAGFVVREGRMIRTTNETIVGYGLMRRLGLRVGDHITLTIASAPLPVTVVGWYSETEDSGEIAQIRIEALRQVEPAADAGEIFVRTKTLADAQRLDVQLQKSLPDTVRTTLADNDTGDLDAFKAAFYAITALVLVVALVNLATTLLLGVREHLRDIAVLKTIGFTPRQVGQSVASGAAALALVAAIVGIPTGLIVARVMLDGIGRDIGLGPGFATGPSLASALAVAPIVVAIAAALGAVISSAAARADVAQILRAE
jgi:putative ABC transport system permease protein